MKADCRLGLLAFAAGLWLGSPAFAQAVPQNTQQTAPPATSSPATPDTVGPRELQNFSLGGTATAPAEPVPMSPPPPPTTPPATNRNANRVGAPATTTPPSAEATGRTTGRPTVAAPPTQAPATSTSTPTPTAPHRVTPGLPTPVPGPSARIPPAAASPPSFTPEPETASPAVAAAHGSSMLPWLLAAVVLAGGLAFLLWRRRPREALAGGPDIDSYAPAEPPAPPVASPRVAAPPPPNSAPVAAPTPVPAAAAAAAPGTVRAFASAPAPPQPVGIVSTRLRPWLDVTIVPVACQIDDQQIAFEFEIDVFNSGAAPARDIVVAATLFNAGPTQEQDIAAFMSQPIREGDPLPPIPPLQRVTFRTALRARRASLQLFEAAGRQLFVPILAFNALYRWGGGAGQTCGSYLVGRDTGAEKLAPLRADAGSRALGGLGARLLPTGIRN